MVQCVLGVSLYNSEAVGKCFSEMNLRPEKRKNEPDILAISNKMEEHTGNFSQLLYLRCHQVFVFLKYATCHFLMGSPLTIQFLLIRVKATEVHIHGEHCVLGMHLHSFETAGRYLL